MPFHRCTVCRDDGSVVAKDVTVSLDQTAAADAPRWYGTITVAHWSELVAGQRYHMVLDDGRTGEFTVRRNTFAGDTNRAVAIDGVGPLGLPG